MPRQYYPFSGIAIFLFTIFSIFTNIHLAQAFDVMPPADVRAPIIKHEASIYSVRAGEPLIIEADVSDTSGVEKVILFYRLSGDSKYKRLQMQWTGGIRYQATIPSREVAEPGIEYYLRATDTAGNAALRGLAFSLLRVKVEPGAAVEQAVGPPVQPAIPPKKEQKKSNTILWVLGGALLVGAAVAMGSGGGGGDPESTGTVIFSGATP